MKMTINLRKVLFFLLTLCLIGSAYAQDTALKEAEVAYTKEDYAKAIELYEGILKSNGESAAVYYKFLHYTTSQHFCIICHKVTVCYFVFFFSRSSSTTARIRSFVSLR